MREETRRLLDEIAHCPIVASCKSGTDHACGRVVESQRDVPLGRHQVPEPWSGRLDQALILFVTTSPPIARGEEYALWSHTAEQLGEYFEERFGEGPRQIRDGIYPPIPGRHSSTPLQSWVELKSRAAEIVDDPVPGADYAVSYAVHCRTDGELGVRRAMTACPDRYLRRIVAAAARALVIVAVGPQAAAAVREVLEVAVTNEVRHVGPVLLEGQQRHVIYLDHFGGYGALKEVAAAVDADVLESIRAAVSIRRARAAVTASVAAARATEAQAPTADEIVAVVRRCLHDVTVSFEPREPVWLAEHGRLADTLLLRYGWRLQQTLAARGVDVLVLANPLCLIVGTPHRALACCDYTVATAWDCLQPLGVDRVVEQALQRFHPSMGGAVALAALAVPAPVGDDGALDTGALDDVAEVLTPQLRLRGAVHRHRVHDADAVTSCLDVYLVGPRTPADETGT